MAPTISVVIPIYNEGVHIEEVLSANLASFEASRARITEVILVDDGSTDDTPHILNQFAAAYRGPLALCVLHHARNHGKARAVRTGAAASAGAVVLFTDSDTQFPASSLDRLPAALSHAGCVVGEVVPSQDGLLARLQGIEYAYEQRVLREVQGFYANVLSIPGPYYALWRKHLDAIDWGDSIVEDFRVGIQLNLRGVRIAHLDAPVYTIVPEDLRTLRRQRLRWFGGILRESLAHPRVWGANPFYLINVVICFMSFLVTLVSLTSLPRAFLGTQPLFALGGIVLFALLLNTIVALFYMVGSRQYALDLLIFLPMYLYFLFLVRSEAIVQMILHRRIPWGTR